MILFSEAMSADLFRHLIQVAGIASLEEARMLVECGVKYLGFPLRLSVHQEDLSEEEAARISRSLISPCQAVAITYQNNALEVAELSQFLDAGMVQLHGDIGVGQLSRLKSIRPDLQVIKSLIVGLYNPAQLRVMVRAMEPFVDAFITDTYDAVNGASGATGKIHDWEISRDLVAFSARPVILAGGLTPENVRQAILAVRPSGVDTHTGVEDACGKKDRDKVKRFVEQADLAFALIQGSC
jgi:phosphoribosylanthranilate isomerase